MAFWQASAGGWGDKLPGGAKDTMASTELAVSRANIWVIDDLAPTGDQRQTQAELARLGDLIRSVHNGSGKRRADQNMDLRATHDPRALLIITAENEHNVASVRDRIVFAPVDGLGTDEAVAAVERMRDVTGIPGRVSGRCSRTWPGSPPPTGGRSTRRCSPGSMTGTPGTAADATGDGDKAIRHGRLAADIVLGLRVLGDYAAETGCKDLRPLIGGMATDVFSLVAEHYVSQKTTTPGRSALAAVRAILASGQAHVVSLTTPGASPATGEEASSINNLLGWTATPDGGSRPGGPSIGWIAYPKGEGVVFLNAIPASMRPAATTRTSSPTGPPIGRPGNRRGTRACARIAGPANRTTVGDRGLRSGPPEVALRGFRLVGGGCSHPAEVHRRRRRRGARRRERTGGGQARDPVGGQRQRFP